MASEEKVSEVISVFRCEKDPDIENFIKNKAIVYEQKAKSRTYLKTALRCSARTLMRS